MEQTNKETEINVEELIEELNDGACHYRVEIVCGTLPISVSFVPERVGGCTSGDNVLILHSKGEDVKISRVSKVLKCKQISGSSQLVYKVTTCGILGQKINLRIIQHFEEVS